ncbi:MAG TPA: ABC transporter ATP-binding protein [Aggregatilineales bacterium]|nr:ABC transporter ATP-binding protein [Aggregatilineales bacterium]
MTLVHTESLSKVYGSAAQPVQALNSVNLAVDEGEFVAIMGPSGSGKSTLLYLLGGLDKPTSGRTWLRDADLSTLNDDALSTIRRKDIGFIFQFFNLIPVLTARENVAMPLILDGVPRAEALKRADEALARVNLSDRGTHRPAELSGGEQQRVALARALVTNPALILGDEPTGNLDSRSGDEMVQLLRRAADEWKRTIIIVTHDPRIAAFADRIVFLKDGQIVDENRLKGQGNADQIRDQFNKVTVD